MKEESQKKSKRGISDQKFIIACCIDENRNIHCEASIKGRITSEALIDIYEGVINEGTKVVSDSLRSYHKLMKHLKVDCVKIPSKKKEYNGYTLERINSLHSCIKNFLYEYRGIAAKYAQNYLALFMYQWNNGAISNLKVAEQIFERIAYEFQVTRNYTFSRKNKALSLIFER